MKFVWVLNPKRKGGMLLYHFLPLNHWRWLWNSLANNYESLKLELSGAWEPPSSSGPSPAGEKQPNLLFLMETRATNKKLQAIRRSLGFEGMFSVDPVGFSGGIALFWKNNGEVSIQNYSLRHINASIKLLDSDFEWKLTGFYGNPN
jgi:hypothetical protein